MINSRANFFSPEDVKGFTQYEGKNELIVFFDEFFKCEYKMFKEG